MPSATDGPGAARADPPPVSELRLPTGKVALLLLGLCRQGQALEPIDDRGDGRLWFRWQGLRGVGEGAVGILADDEEALEALRRAPGAVRSYVELLAVLSCVHSLANADGQWRLERVASLLYGPRTPSSHRARQLPGIRGWLALLERGYFQLAVPADKGSRPAADVIAGQLLTMERSASGHARTVRPLPALRAALGSFTVLVPAAYFALADDGHHNPEGNLPGLPMKARLRCATSLAWIASACSGGATCRSGPRSCGASSSVPRRSAPAWRASSAPRATVATRSSARCCGRSCARPGA